MELEGDMHIEHVVPLFNGRLQRPGESPDPLQRLQYQKGWLAGPGSLVHSRVTFDHAFDLTTRRFRGHILDTKAPKRTEIDRKPQKSETQKGPVSIEETRPSE